MRFQLLYGFRRVIKWARNNFLEDLMNSLKYIFLEEQQFLFLIRKVTFKTLSKLYLFQRKVSEDLDLHFSSHQSLKTNYRRPFILSLVTFSSYWLLHPAGHIAITAVFINTLYFISTRETCAVFYEHRYCLGLSRKGFSSITYIKHPIHESNPALTFI